MAEKGNRYTEKKAEYDKKYHREKMLSIAFRLHKDSDADLIEIYSNIPDKSAWFRKALRDYKG